MFGFEFRWGHNWNLGVGGVARLTEDQQAEFRYSRFHKKLWGCSLVGQNGALSMLRSSVRIRSVPQQILEGSIHGNN